MMNGDIRAKQIKLPLLYLPSISYFVVLSRAQVFNFCIPKKIVPALHAKSYILGANGPVALQIPLKKSSKNAGKAEIYFGHKWQQKHWQSILSAFGKTPYFEEVETDLKNILFANHNSLWQLNAILIQLFCQMIFKKTDSVNPAEICNTVFTNKMMHNLPIFEKVFPCKNNQIPNLSILDLFCNIGPATLEFLIYKSNHLNTHYNIKFKIE